MQTSPRLDADVTTTTPTAQKLAMGILMLGALTLGASVVMGLVALPRKSFRVAPLQPTSVVWVFYTRQANEPTIPTGLYFSRASQQLGWLPIGGGFTEQEPSYDLTGALAVAVRQDWQSNPQDHQNLPATVLTVTYRDLGGPNTNVGGEQRRISLCLPEVSFGEVSGYTNSNTNTGPARERVFYFDREGTPYLDARLSRRATTTSCLNLLAAALRPADMTHAALNAFYHGVHLTFSRIQGRHLGYQLGILNQRNEWADGTDFGVDRVSNAPLQVSVAVPQDLQVNDPTSPEFIALPARTLTVVADGQTSTLCLPTDSLRIQPTYETLDYFFRADGTPFRDALLTEPAITGSCSQLLANALVPRTVTDAQLNQPFQAVGTQHPIFTFGREATVLRTLDTVTNEDTARDTIPPTNTGRSPLSVSVDVSTNPPTILPARTLTIVADGQTRALCWPETQAGPPVDGDVTSTYRVYFYDANGQPYLDNLLTQPVTCSLAGTKPPAEVAP